MLKFLSVLTAVSMLFMGGCATIVKGTDQNLSFNSEPEGATVSIDEKVLGKTPVTVPVDKDQGLTITFEKEGYQLYTAQLTTETQAWFWGNILIGGLIGSTTDGVSGAIHEFSPDNYYVTLVPIEDNLSDRTQERKVRELVVAFGTDIRNELSQGNGEKLDALIELLDSSDPAASKQVIAQHAGEHSNDLELANSLIAHYKL